MDSLTPLPPAALRFAVILGTVALTVALLLPAAVPGQPDLLAAPLAVAVVAWGLPVLLALAGGRRWAAVLALAVLLFATAASFRTRQWADKDLDWQVLAKGAIWLACGVAGILRLGRSGRLLARPPAALALAFLAMVLVSALWSPNPSYSALSGVSYLCLFVFALAVAESLDEEGLLLAIAVGTGLVVLPSLVIAPFAVGISAISPGSTGEADRLRGITDHPIPLAEASALFVFACLALRRRHGGAVARLLLLALAAAGVATALLTQSRLPPLAMIAACTAYAAYRRGGAALMLPVLTVFVGGALAAESLAGLAALIPADFLEMFARSGHSKEILSMSGRLTIWSYAWERFLDKPVLGWGQASGMTVFQGFHAWKIVHAHNAYLQALLYLGISGATLLFAVLLAQLREFVRRPVPVRDVVLLYTLIMGLTEQAMLSNMPSGSAVLWMVTVGMAAAAWGKGRR